MSIRARSGSADTGASLVEILVSILLLGTAGVSMLGALRATVVGTRTELDRAQAQIWLQDAAAELDATERIGCAEGEDAIRTGYLTHLRATVEPPHGWASTQLVILAPVLAWDGQQYRPLPTAGANGGPCLDDAGFSLQLVTIAVTKTSGETILQLAVVKP